MSAKKKIILGGFGLIGLNVFVMALLAVWPVVHKDDASASTVLAGQQGVSDVTPNPSVQPLTPILNPSPQPSPAGRGSTRGEGEYAWRAVVPAPPLSLGGGGEGVPQGIDVASTSLSTSNMVVPATAGGIDKMADVGHKSATESVVAEVDKVVIPVYTKDTVLSAMEAYQDTDRDFSFAGTKYPGLGFFVETLRGIEQGDGMYWILYVNDESSDLGASRTVVALGDVVEWRLEASPF